MKRIAKGPLQRRLEVTNWVLLALLVAGSLLWGGVRFSLGVALGGAISAVNFHWLGRNLSSAFAGELGRLRSAMMRRYFIRLAVTTGLLLAIITGDVADVIGLVVGLSVVVLNIVLTVVLSLLRTGPGSLSLD